MIVYSSLEGVVHCVGISVVLWSWEWVWPRVKRMAGMLGLPGRGVCEVSCASWLKYEHLVSTTLTLHGLALKALAALGGTRCVFVV